MKTDSLIEPLDNMHRETRLLRTKAREEAITRHKEKTNVQPGNVGVGNYVLVGQKTGNMVIRFLLPGADRRGFQGSCQILYMSAKILFRTLFHAARQSFEVLF